MWDYIAAEKINVPTIYYAHERQVTLRDGMWIAITDVTPARPGEVIEVRSLVTEQWETCPARPPSSPMPTRCRT